MKNRRNDEWVDEFAYKIALSALCVCIGILDATKMMILTELFENKATVTQDVLFTILGVGWKKKDNG